MLFEELRNLETVGERARTDEMTTETETEREATVLRAVYEQGINKEEQRKEPRNKT